MMTSEKLKKIDLLLLDVDGVLTDGSIIYDDRGVEIKVFNVKDGLGIRMLKAAGIDVGIVTGRRSEALRHRCRDLGISLLLEGIQDKAAILEHLEAETGVTAGKMAFMGDDLPDLPLMKRVGASITVADGHRIVKKFADIVTKAKGGNGAVRELCEAILSAGDHWEKIVKEYGE